MASIRTLLKNGKVVFVSFVKANGEIRRMICTQDLDRIPRVMHPRTGMVYDKSQIRVWDIVAQEWRSMKEDRIHEYEEYRASVG